MAKIVKTIKIPAKYVYQVQTSGTKLEPFSLGINSTTWGCMEFQFWGSMRDVFFHNNENIISVGLEYSYNYADMEYPIENLRFIEISNSSDPPHNLVGSDIFSAISSGGLYTDQHLFGNLRTENFVDLTDILKDWVQTNIESTDGTYTWIAIGLLPADLLGSGTVSVGGMTLAGGLGAPWQETQSGEFSLPPTLVIEYGIDEQSHRTQEMRYTTLDPSTPQSTPANSLGGFVSLNQVYEETQLGDFLGSDETIISIIPTYDLDNVPSSGLVSIGPEVMKYTSIDKSDHKLLGVARNISPGYSFPSSLEPYPEYVRFLDIDQLFNTNPTDSLVQYRCVAIINTGDPIYATKVFVRQNSLSTVQMDVGIEIPEFDTISGSHTGIAGTTIEDNLTFVSTSVTSGKYDGGGIIITSGIYGTTYATIDSFTINAGTATITFEESITIAVGDSYRILPAPSGRIANETVTPTSTNFLGFLSESGNNQVVLGDHGSEIQQFDLFYLWVRKTYIENADKSDNTGAIIMITFEEEQNG